jgi:hypothetical protein
VLSDGLDGQERLLADGGILLVGQLLLESLDGPELASHVSSEFLQIFGATHENALKILPGKKWGACNKWRGLIRRERGSAQPLSGDRGGGECVAPLRAHKAFIARVPGRRPR